MANQDRFCICISDAPQASNEKAALLNQARWNPGDVIRVKFLEGDSSLQDRVRSTAERWTESGMANLQFQWVDEGDAEVRIAFEQGNGSWSYLGTVCKSIPDTDPTMNYGWLTPDSDDAELNRVVMHEFGHSLGLIHEHQNPEGGIQWNEPAVIAELSGPPNNWDEEQIRTNVLNHYPQDEMTTTPVDSDSIMMYPIPESWTLDGFSADLNDDVSQQDGEFIHQEYPGNDQPDSAGLIADMAVNDDDWAVVISVSGCEGATAQPPWMTNPKGPDNDAAAIAEWLTSPEGGGLPADNVLRVPSPFAPVAPFVHASLAPGEDEDEVMRRLTTSLLAPRSALEDFRMVEPA